LAPVGRVGQVALALTVHEKVPAKTFAELVTYSKTKPLNFAAAGVAHCAGRQRLGQRGDGELLLDAQDRAHGGRSG